MTIEKRMKQWQANCREQWNKECKDPKRSIFPDIGPPTGKARETKK